MSRPEIIMLNGVTVADVARALRKSGLAISNGAFPTLFVIARAASRFPDSNVIDLAAPSLLKRQAGPIHDIRGIDYGIDSPIDAA